MNNMPVFKKIHLDMDGPLVDDIAMYAKYSNMSIVDVREHIEVIKMLGRKQEFVFPIIKKAIADGHFAKATPTFFHYQLVNYLIPYWKSLGIEVGILSSTMKDNPDAEYLATQKKEWLFNNKLGDISTIFSNGSADKQNYAETGHLLIDDYDRTIGQFISKGGFALHYTSCSETIYKLTLLGLVPKFF